MIYLLAYVLFVFLVLTFLKIGPLCDEEIQRMRH